MCLPPCPRSSRHTAFRTKPRNVGFDWEEREQVWDKVKEEIGEFQAEVARMDKQKAEEEFGDVMFSLINAARLYKINPDNALEHTNQKFIRRFNYVEAHSIKEGRNLHDMTLEEMDKLWEEAKALEKKRKLKFTYYLFLFRHGITWISRKKIKINPCNSASERNHQVYLDTLSF